jgi:hypothetical protein
VFALQLAWKLSGDKTNMKLKKKVIKEIAAENNIMVDFSEFPGVISQDSGGPNEFRVRLRTFPQHMMNCLGAKQSKEI